MGSDPYRKAATIAVLAAAALFGLAYIALPGLNPYVLLLLSLTGVTFAFYGVDKSAARSGRGRTPEAFLHLMALAGGFAGGWLGMYVFRHKTLKASFKVVLVVATVLHLLLIGPALVPGWPLPSLAGLF